MLLSLWLLSQESAARDIEQQSAKTQQLSADLQKRAKESEVCLLLIRPHPLSRILPSTSLFLPRFSCSCPLMSFLLLR